MKTLFFVMMLFCSLFAQASLDDSLKIKKVPNPLGLSYSINYQDLDPNCEICGCGSGNYYLGVMPMLNMSFVGLRHQTQSFDSHLSFPESERTKETFNTTELWGRFYPTKRVQVFALLPYSSNIQKTVYMEKKLKGIGDASVLANYNIYTNVSADTTKKKNFKHSLWAGGGIKLPTGKHTYDEVDLSQVANPNFQLGTGSLDYIMNMLYTIRYKKIGLSMDATYKINGRNKDKYQFGNKIAGSVNLFYLKELLKGKVGLMGSTGLSSESTNTNRKGNREIKRTGGTISTFNLGADVYYRFIVIGYSFRNPIAQNLSKGETSSSASQLMHITIMF